MKSKFSLFLLFTFLLSACNIPVTPTQTAIPTLSQTPIPSTATSTPQSTVTPRPPQDPDDVSFIKGMSYVTWTESNYSHPLADKALEDLAKTGTTWIAIIATTTQKTIDSTQIDSLNNTDESIIHAIQTAHRLNMKVMLKPHVDLSEDSEHWRGQIGTNFGASEWNEWFASYTEMILHYAKIAEENGVEIFCIGTELNMAQMQTEHFQQLAVDVRSVFSGLLIYASNWDSIQHNWWDSVDYIGVDAYFPLTQTRAPSIETLTANWKPIANELEALSKKWNRKLIFTEIGYTAQEYTAREPASSENGLLSPQTQANAYQAAFNVFRDKEWFNGMFWWMWGDTTFDGGMCDPQHTPKDKLAENILRAEYGAPLATLPEPAALPIFDETKTVSYPICTDAYASEIDPNWSWNLTDKVVDDLVFAGQKSLEINFQGWSGFSPHLNNIDTTPYQWLEFYIYTNEDLATTLIVDVADENNQVAYKQPITRCNYFDNSTGLNLGEWNRVLIPLEQIDADKRLISLVILEHWSSDAVTIWVDEMRLVGLK